MATTLEVKKTAPAPAATDAWRSFRTEMDKLMDRFAGGFGLPSLRRMFDMAPMFGFEGAVTMPTPAIDVTEDAACYKVTAELPGMDEKDIEVALTDEMLTIKGEKKLETEEKDKEYYLSERSYGMFRRSFALPDGIDRNKVAAAFAKGVLTVTLPKSEVAKVEPTKIEVKAAA
ncbi:MAG TPA: Hsp20/alpha crystallin family protein [Acetobacteraceae bacterium]|nr:Hsp20/alpha crystallin family protein [Acetobacteraceae bacterium]